MTPQNHIHILGICGRFTSAVARMLQDKGHVVTGSDQNSYPPTSLYLNNIGINFNSTYSPKNIGSNVDQVIIGGNTLHVDPRNPEYLEARKRKLQIKSVAQVIGEHIIRPESIVVAGTYGKTTITTLLIHLFNNLDLKPAFAVGEAMNIFKKYTQIKYLNNIYATDSQYSIVEGDEHPTLGFDDQPKFIYYKPKHVIITSALWDHFNIYKSEQDYINTFKLLIDLIPSDGSVIINPHAPNTKQLIEYATQKGITIIKYGINKSGLTYSASDINFQNGTFTINTPTKSILLQTQLLGQHNVENLVAAMALTLNLFGDVNLKKLRNAIPKIKAVPHRLERQTPISNKIQFFEDKGQHPGKVKASVDALKEHYPDSQLFVIYSPDASVLYDTHIYNFFDNTFNSADYVLIPRLKHRSTTKERVTGSKLVEVINRSKNNAHYVPLDKQLDNFIKTHSKPNDVVLILTSGNYWEIMLKISKY